MLSFMIRKFKIATSSFLHFSEANNLISLAYFILIIQQYLSIATIMSYSIYYSKAYTSFP